MTAGAKNGERARRVAVEVLNTGRAGDQFTRSRGRVLDPVPVRTLDGAAAGWFVGIEFDGRLLGFVQLDTDGRFRRYASFQRRPGSAEGCPLARDWLDPAAILQQARTLADPEDRLESPMLSFDRSPDRLAWAVRSTSHGREKTILVAGTYAYRLADSPEPSTG
jgi:hypothetical protein